MGSVSWVRPTEGASSTFLTSDQRVEFSPDGLDVILLEKRSAFDLGKINKVCIAYIDQVAPLLSTKPNVIMAGIVMHLMKNGASRSVNTAGFKIAFDISGDFVKISEEFKIEIDKESKHPTMDIAPLLRAIEREANKQYEGIVSTNHSSSGSKLFLRCFAHIVPLVMSKQGGADVNKLKAMSKVACKLNLSELTDIVLSTHATSDFQSLSRKDAIRFLRIMSAYMKRSRSGKSATDVNGKKVEQKEIFLSLCSRVSISHSLMSNWDPSESEKIWENADLINSDKADLASVIKGPKGVMTLAELFR